MSERPEATLPADPQAYVAQVMAEIAEEVRLRRASGDLPPKLERELDELFLAHSPVAGRGGDLGEALRMVDAATFIDPVVPVESERAAGAAVKKGMRSLLLWYVGWITHQMSQFASAVSRALHIVDDRLKELSARSRSSGCRPRGVVEFPGLARPRRLVGRARRGRRGRGARAASSTPPAATAGWCGASPPPAATPTASTPARHVVDAAELRRPTCAGRPWPTTCAPSPRPAWARSCSAAWWTAWPAASAASCSPPSRPAWPRAARWSSTR